MSETNGQPVDDRKVIYLGMPCTGHMTMGAAMGFHRATRRKSHHVELLGLGSSLATGNFNRLWCWALNAAKKGRVDYFAMQHSDIEPQEYWLDPLIDELEAKSLDVLGVVAPIKDRRGYTSIAVAHETGDTYRIRNRLTMHEVCRLPETFTSDDVGGPLLLNTGLWVCRFKEEWAKHIFFTVNDRIMIDPDGEYIAQIEPEDWFFSRLCHELSLRVGCTRKVALAHRGDVAYTNDRPWGTNEFDREWATGSFLNPPQGADWFPHDAAGWLTPEEGAELARLAAGKVVLEIGAYCGRSTVCLARDAVSVFTIDTFDGRGTANPGHTFSTFKQNLKRYGVERKVTASIGESAERLACLPAVYDLAFVDGSHAQADVLADAQGAAAVLRPGGVLVFHDYHSPGNSGVTAAIDEFVSGGGEILSRVGTLAVVRPPAAVLVGGN